MDTPRINVTKTFLPPLEEYQSYLAGIWERNYLTNQGPLLQELEQNVQDRLGVTNFHFVTNGTLALQVALRALDLTEGEIITTPFSYVATTSAILWERCTPVFVDIDPDTLCIDPAKIEAAITPRTKAILPVHVFGYPCDVEAIDAIAAKHNLKVVYDAAHAFDATYKGESLMAHGDISVGSFHATKLFHTIEGGGIFVRNDAVNEKVELIKRFGHHGDDHFLLGTNAKANEFQAAMGLTNFKYIGEIKAGRKRVSDHYDRELAGVFKRPTVPAELDYNYAYYPVIAQSEAELLRLIEALNKENIFPRRYFYPALHTLPYIKEEHACPVAEDIASRVMCLPLYPDLDPKDVQRICDILKK